MGVHPTRRRTTSLLLFLCLTALPLRGAPAPGRPGGAGSTGPPGAARVDWHQTLENWKNLVAVVGTLVAGAFTYLKFFRGRTFAPRLELGVKGELLVDGEARCLLATLTLKNVGLSKVELDARVTRLEVALYERGAYEFLYANPPADGAEVVRPAYWGEPHPFRVFTPHGWVESGETIADQLLVTIPAGDYLAYRLTFVATAPETELRRTIDWTVTAIVHPKPAAETNADGAKNQEDIDDDNES